MIDRNYKFCQEIFPILRFKTFLKYQLTMKITIPELSLVVLIGVSGAGKSTFARKHFQNFEIISLDFCRGLVSNDENNQSASKEALDVLRYIVAKRLAIGKLTVVDAINVYPADRKELVQLARQYHFFPVAIAFNLPEELCHQRNQQRPGCQFGPHVVYRHTHFWRRSLKGLEREGFRYVYILNSPEEVDAVEIERQPLWNNRKHEHGPFDIIGDVHGCCDELEQLLQKLGYIKASSIAEVRNSGSLVVSCCFPSLWDNAPTYYHPQGRKVIFLGDLVDRGPRILDTVRLVRNMVFQGTALCVPGNHENKLLQKLRGKNVKVNHGLEQTLAEIAALPEQVRPAFTKQLKEFLDSLVSHYILDAGRLVVAHAGMKQEYQGRGSAQVREFALYGESGGEIEEFGLPVRNNWAVQYRGEAMVVYGHTPIPEAQWLNNTINIDTGCVFGGKLTALRYPERELVSVPAFRRYYESVRPTSKTDSIKPDTSQTAQQPDDDLLHVEDVLGKRVINTRLVSGITISQENAIAAMEAMSRFAVNPKWLIYLPPAISPADASTFEAEYLEHPSSAFAYYQSQKIGEVICEEKHMGFQVVVIVCRDQTVAEKRFAVVDEGIGICYTRTGQRFFEDTSLQTQFLMRLNTALTRSGFWKRFDTDWVCLDCELMPWSAKAQRLLPKLYAPVGVASRLALHEAVTLLAKASVLGFDVNTQLKDYQKRVEMAHRYVSTYRRYYQTTSNISDFQLVPFHLLATENAVHADKDHYWHRQEVANIASHDSQLLLATGYKVIDLYNSDDLAAGVDWWKQLTARGKEGIVVKPVPFIVKGDSGIVQPAIKCRGREYLRLVYGPEYDLPHNWQYLRQRKLLRKRSLAIQEFALGMEALQRFVTRAPLALVHECVFAILALESEPVDPGL
jgi:protein phosphatase